MAHPPTEPPAGPPPAPATRAPIWAWLALAAILALDVWLRGHTFGPLVREACGFDAYFTAGAEGEAIDCDEAIYAYYGRRIAGGAVLYRDLAEPKPPGGYWLFALGVKLGGANEGMVRVLPIPLVLATIALIWWLGLRLAGPAAGCVAALAYALTSTDPYLYGNGSNLEHPINLLSTAALALLVFGWARPGRGAIVAAGACVGAACLFKQVAILHLIAGGLALLARRVGWRRKVGDLAALAIGFAAPLAIATGVLVLQGAGRAAFDQVVTYGAAMAAETPPPPHSPPGWMRFVVGNADPRDGSLPWPFGRTDWLTWWGTGTWPFWAVAVPALAWLALGKAAARRRLAAAWTASAFTQVALPGLYWAHYYLLPLPGLAIALGVAAGDLSRGRKARASRVAGLLIIAAALAGTAAIQVRDYLMVPPDRLAEKYKGGRQWGGQRKLGRELKRLMANVPGAKLFVWGTSSPLFIHSGMDGVTPFSFADPLMQAKAVADPGHPLIRPRLDRIMADLRAHPPEVVFVADPPFPELVAFLKGRYRRAGWLGPVWIENGVPLSRARP